MELIKRKGIRLQWEGRRPPGLARTVMLIPQYNESSRTCIESRLDYFSCLGRQFEGRIEIVIIDDGSTDDSLERIRNFARLNDPPLYIAAVCPNGNKVGALSCLTRELDHEYVILTDLDTDILGLENLLDRLDHLRKDSILMGGYFRMVPYEGTGTIFQFQQLEYSIARSLYKFHSKERSVPVMPGAGCCFKREILDAVYCEHTGLRNGEDREATLIGLKKGYGASYYNDVLALTRPPLNFKALCKQRTRWYLGYIETIFLQRGFERVPEGSMNRLKVRTYLDVAIVATILLLPLAIAVVGLFHPMLLLPGLLGLYLISVLWCTALIIISPEESEEFRMRIVHTVLLYPLIKLALDYVSWMAAFRKFLRTDYSKIVGEMAA